MSAELSPPNLRPHPCWACLWDKANRMIFPTSLPFPVQQREPRIPNHKPGSPYLQHPQVSFSLYPQGQHHPSSLLRSVVCSEKEGCQRAVSFREMALATPQDLWYQESQRHTSHRLCLFLLASLPLPITGTGCWWMWLLKGHRAHGEACQEGPRKTTVAGLGWGDVPA